MDVVIPNRCVKQTGRRTFAVYATSDYNDNEATMKFVNELATWCKKTFGNDYETWNFKSNGCFFTFDKIEDAIAFKLRWM